MRATAPGGLTTRPRALLALALLLIVAGVAVGAAGGSGRHASAPSPGTPRVLAEETMVEVRRAMGVGPPV